MPVFQDCFPQIAYLKKKEQVYLDSAATTLKPKCVTKILKHFYETQVCNVHRGSHFLSDDLTLQYEQARRRVQKWIQASSAEEVIFTKSTTEGINFLSVSLGSRLEPGDEVLLTEMEHHSNLVPWQELARQKHLKLRFIPVDETGELVLKDVDSFFGPRTKILAFTYYSNVLGTRNPVEKLCTLARQKDIITVVDAAQAMTAEPVNVQALGVDFLVFSGHKLFAPAGTGVLYAKKKHLKNLRPYQWGGGMVEDVGSTDSEWALAPARFEAGTPFVEGVLSLSGVLDFLEGQNFFGPLKDKTSFLMQKAEERLLKIKGLKIVGTSPTKRNISSFVVEGIHSQDLGHIISQAGVAVRAGHHCCLPLMKKYGLSSGTVRASWAAYNEESDIDAFVQAVQKARGLLL